MVNIGASFGHGCTSCTVNPTLREHNQESGDSSWIRRNYLVQFLKNVKWKNPSLFNYDFISIVENDSRENFAKIFNDRSLKRSPYRSRWQYDKKTDLTSEMSFSTEIEILSNPNFHDESELIGGAYVRKKKKAIKNKKKKMIGHLYQSYPGSHYQSGARSKSVFDLGTDSATIEKFFINMAGKKLIKKLKKSKWKKAKLREKVKDIIVEKIQKMNPTIISAIDPIFWDSIPRMLHYAREKNPRSFIMKFLTSKLFGKLSKVKLRSKEFENRKFDDFFEIMARISVNKKTGKPVPVIMANLIDRPGKHIHDNQLEAVFGTLIGNYVYVVTGIDFTKEFIKWLKELEYEDKSQEVEAKAFYNKLKKLSLEEIGATPEEIINTQYIIGGIGDKVRGKLFKIILKAFGDLPLMIKSIDKAFTELNKKVTTFASRDDHNVYLLDAKHFYENFHILVHPKTMHPTVKGAKFMAKMFAEAPCKKPKERKE